MPMTRRRFLNVAVAGAVGLAAAPALWALASRSGTEDGPPAIAYGRDRCEACGMLIGDVRFAAVAREGGLVRRFDDIGCLVRRSGAALAAGRGRAWVHDAVTEAWLAAEAAWYVRSPRIRTPMNYGIAAFEDRETARRASAGAELLTFAAVLAAVPREAS